MIRELALEVFGRRNGGLVFWKIFCRGASFWVFGLLLILGTAFLVKIFPAEVTDVWIFLPALANATSAIFGVAFILYFTHKKKHLLCTESWTVELSMGVVFFLGVIAVLSILAAWLWKWDKVYQLVFALLIYGLALWHDYLVRSGARSHHLYSVQNPSQADATDQRDLMSLEKKALDWTNSVNMPSFLILTLLFGFSLVYHGTIPILAPLGMLPDSTAAEVYLSGAITFHMLHSLYMFGSDHEGWFQNLLHLGI